MRDDKRVNTMWNRSQVGPDSTPQDLTLTQETKAKIQDAFASQPAEDSVKAYKTPVDTESMAKVVC